MTAKWIERSMNLAIRRARYERASISMDPNNPFQNDTQAIRDATKLYVDSWLIPLLRAVRDGDSRLAKLLTEGHNCSNPLDK